MFDENPISRYLVSSLVARHSLNLTQILGDLCEYCEFANATFFRPSSQRRATRDVLVTTYCNEWVGRYFEAGYQHIDPVVRVGLNSTLPVDWSSIGLRSPAERRFFSEALDYKVGRSGLTVAARAPLGQVGLFSVTTDERARIWSTRVREIAADVTYSAFLLLDAVLAEESESGEWVQASLTSREAEVLRWAAHGKTAWETARLLSLSQRTVEFYLTNCCEKLKVTTKTQAVARALADNLILL